MLFEIVRCRLPMPHAEHNRLNDNTSSKTRFHDCIFILCIRLQLYRDGRGRGGQAESPLAHAWLVRENGGRVVFWGWCSLSYGLFHMQTLGDTRFDEKRFSDTQRGFAPGLCFVTFASKIAPHDDPWFGVFCLTPH